MLRKRAALYISSVLLLALLTTACGGAGSAATPATTPTSWHGQTSMTPNPDGRPISWAEAGCLMLSGKVAQAFQTHALDVTLYLKGGDKVVAKEPYIDAMFDLVKACGESCSDILLATE